MDHLRSGGRVRKAPASSDRSASARRRSLAVAGPARAHALPRRVHRSGLMAVDWRRLAPVLLAGSLGAVYVIVSPPSLDLAAHLLRAKLFRTEGFAIWSNWWYAGHHLPGYSVLFPAAAGVLSPQLAAAIAATASAAIFETWVRDRFGRDAWLGALWFGAATATNLFTGRLAFAFGLLPGLAAAWSLSRRRTSLAWLLGAVTALSSPVAALFTALVGAADAIGGFLSGDRRNAT